MRSVLRTLGEDTLACAISLVGLVVLALTLGAIWHTGTKATLIAAVSGAVLAYLLVWARVPSGLSPLLAQCFGAVLCVRLAASLPLLPANRVLYLHEGGTSPATGWVVDLVNRTVGPERAVFLLLLFLLWEVAYTMVWLVLRERWAWAAGSLAGIALVAGAGVAGTIGGQVVVFAVAVLTLVLWTTWVDHGLVWRRGRATVAPYTRPIALAAGLVILLLAGALAWALITPSRATVDAATSPGARLTQLMRLWQQTSHRLAASLTGGPTQSGTALGQGAPLLLDHPFTPHGIAAVRISGAIPSDWPAMYWRSTVYDTYTGGTWLPALGPNETVPADGLLEPVTTGEKIVTLRYRLLGQSDGSALVSAGRLLRVDMPTFIMRNDTGLLAVHAASGLREYSATSTWPSGQASTGDMRESWSAADLAVPQDAQSLALLARGITARAASTEAQAAALQTYLRTSFTYDTRVGSPPTGQDPVAYFLLSSHRGYCAHFASAMALLARSLGLPARLVGGYAGGTADGSPVSSVLLRDADAHTWPEIFLPGQGWTLYEPTPGFAHPGGGAPSMPHAQAGLPAHLVRPVAPASPRQVLPVHKPEFQPSQIQLDILVLLLLGFLAVSGLVVAVHRQVQRQLSLAAQVARAYSLMFRLIPLTPHRAETARHFAARVARYDPRAAPDALWLAALYERVCYGRGIPSAAEVRQARATVVRLRRLWLRRFFGLRRTAPL